VKAALFHPAAKAAIRSLPDDVRRELGKAIFDLQKGDSLGMSVSRPMSSVAELRIRTGTEFIGPSITACRREGFWCFTRS
jgi:hypothetical protein